MLYYHNTLFPSHFKNNIEMFKKKFVLKERQNQAKRNQERSLKKTALQNNKHDTSAEYKPRFTQNTPTGISCFALC
ncbi:hypothetical protein D6783_03150 [Candidatus Woesearchaeota archaeon]|nr:MAG: hypothetical protein D6783_03150 [Candidatus Woesearchaeota archaeon]